MASPPSSARQAPGRVGACAVGLAYAHRSGSESVAYLVGLADGRIAVLAAARQRVRSLDGIDPQVVNRAVNLLDAAIRSQHQKMGFAQAAPAGG